MKKIVPINVERGRITTGTMASTSSFGMNGAFFIWYPRKGVTFKVIVSEGVPELPWDHVSVSLPNRCPTWEEMCWIKNLFFEEEECVIQYHPPKSKYVNNHPFVLHLWKPLFIEIPMPPSICV